MNKFKIYTTPVNTLATLEKGATSDDHGESLLTPRTTFSECSSSQDFSIGFSLNTNLGESGYITKLAVGYLLTVTVQTKSPNKHTIKKVLEEKLDKLCVSTGVEDKSQLPKSLVSSYKIEAHAEVLSKTDPNTPKEVHILVRGNGQCFIGTTSKRELSAILLLLQETFGISPVPYSFDEEGNIPNFLDSSIQDGLCSKITLGGKAKVYTAEENIINYKGDLYSTDITNVVSDNGCVINVELEYDGTTIFTLDDALTFTGVKFSKALTASSTDEDVLSTTLIKYTELCDTVDLVVDSIKNTK